MDDLTACVLALGTSAIAVPASTIGAVLLLPDARFRHERSSVRFSVSINGLFRGEGGWHWKRVKLQLLQKSKKLWSWPSNMPFFHYYFLNVADTVKYR